MFLCSGLSYNQVVSSWISDYINYEKNNGSLDMVSYSKFFAYVKSKYNSLFVNGAGLDEFIEKLEKEDILDVCNDIEYQLLNYRDVSNLIINNLDLEREMTKEDIYDYVKNVSSPIYQSEQIEKISRLQNKEELVELWKFHLGDTEFLQRMNLSSIKEIPKDVNNFSYETISEHSLGLAGGDIKNITLKLCVKLCSAKYKTLTNDVVIAEIESYLESLEDSKGSECVSEEDIPESVKRELKQ